MSTDPHASFPSRFGDVDELEDFMTRPTRALIDDLAAIDGDIMILGVSGKMGPTIARLAKRAAPEKRIIGVARFSDRGLKDKLQRQHIETIEADLLERHAVKDLPKVENIIFMAGRKFGSTGSEELTWAMNAYVPAVVAENFPNSKIIAYSTACVYPFVPVAGGAAKECTPVDPPGEYAMSCVARERIFEYFSKLHKTPGRLIRLSYAIDMRYGVLHDVAQMVLAKEEIDLSMGYANVIWQGDAASQSLRALKHCTVPTTPLNVSGPEIISIRSLAKTFGRQFGNEPSFGGAEAESAWLADTGEAAGLFGYPVVPLNRMIGWTADWVQRGMQSLDKPTHFEVRSGDY